MIGTYYHCCPKEYFDIQTTTGDWIPHYGATWLAETSREAWAGSQRKSADKVIVSFELDDAMVENHSDMPICKRINRNYYLYRGVIPKYRLKIITTLETA